MRGGTKFIYNVNSTQLLLLPPSRLAASSRNTETEKREYVLTEGEAIFDPLHLAAAIGHLTQQQRFAALVHADV